MEWSSKASEAMDDNQLEIAALWKEGSKQMEEIAKDYEKTAQATDVKNIEQAGLWKGVDSESINNLLSHAETSINAASEAITISENLGINTLYQEIAAFFLRSAEQYRIFLKNKALEDDGKLRQIKNASDLMWEAVPHLQKATEYLSNATDAEAEGLSDVATLWKEQARQMQVISGSYQQVARLDNPGDFREMRSALWNSERCLSQTEEYLSKILGKKACYHSNTARLWMQEAKQMQAIAEDYRQIAQRSVLGDGILGEYFHFPKEQ